MSMRGRFWRAGASLGLGQGSTQVLAFVRNAIVARLVEPDDFGIAATFAITISLLEMIGDLSVEKIIVQDPKGGRRSFQTTAHSVLIIRGLLGGAMLLLLAAPIVHTLQIPESAWAFYWLAAIPVLRGMMHLDYVRHQREVRFGATVTIEAGSEVLVTAIAWPLAAYLRDYSAFLWLLLARAALRVLVSHWIARRAYRLSWDSTLARHMVSFGWPLLVNGLLLFGIYHGDRLIIGSQYGMSTLGMFSTAFILTTMPTRMLTQLGGGLVFPMLARVQNQPADYERGYTLGVQAYAILSVLYVTPFVVLGPCLVLLAFGDKYVVAMPVIGFLAGAQALRLVRALMTAAAMARGDTKLSLQTNCLRAAALLGVLAVAASRGSLDLIAMMAFAGEAAALGLGILRMATRHGVHISATLYPVCVGAGSVLAVVGITTGAVVVTGDAIPQRLALTVILIALQTGVLTYLFPGVRLEALRLFGADARRSSVGSGGRHVTT